MTDTEKVLAKLDEYVHYKEGSFLWIALRRQVEKHTPSDIRYARGFIGCKACSGFGFQKYPCTFIEEVATDLGISE
jgi:hypothetical protein